MPYRWLTCPFGEYTIGTGEDAETLFCAKVRTLIDPGKGKYYSHLPVLDIVRANRTWTVCLVHGVSWTPINADPEISNLFSNLVSSDFEIADGNLIAFHLQQPNQLGWSTARLNRIRQRIIDREVDVTGLTASSPIWRWLERIGQKLDPAFDIQKVAFTPAGG
jgi:hypothetical protein